MFLELLEDYNGVCFFQQIEQKLENAFLAKLSIFFENFVTLIFIYAIQISKDPNGSQKAFRKNMVMSGK